MYFQIVASCIRSLKIEYPHKSLKKEIGAPLSGGGFLSLFCLPWLPAKEAVLKGSFATYLFFPAFSGPGNISWFLLLSKLRIFSDSFLLLRF
jgi:hypothetical protein